MWRLLKSFYRWACFSTKGTCHELHQQLKISQNHIGNELSKSEAMTHWAINISRIESETYKSKLRKQVAFLTFKQAIVYKRYQNAKLDREFFRQRVLTHASKSISCTVHRHEAAKLLKRFCHWKVIAEKSKAREAEEKTYNLKELLLSAKVDAQNSILQIVRERLRTNEKHRFGRKMIDLAQDENGHFSFDHDGEEKNVLNKNAPESNKKISLILTRFSEGKYHIQYLKAIIVT
eukprot:g8837.t1